MDKNIDFSNIMTADDMDNFFIFIDNNLFDIEEAIKTIYSEHRHDDDNGITYDDNVNWDDIDDWEELRDNLQKVYDISYVIWQKYWDKYWKEQNDIKQLNTDSIGVSQAPMLSSVISHIAHSTLTHV